MFSRQITVFTLITLLFFAVAIYLFAQEEIQESYNNIVNLITPSQEPGPPRQDTLYQSFVTSPIDWHTQMNKIKEEGFIGNFFIASITNADYLTRTLTMNFDFNFGGEFSDIRKVVAKSECPIESSYVLLQDNLEVIAEKVDFFDDDGAYIRQSGDNIISYCQNDNCSIIGQECILMRIENEFE